MNTSDVIVIGGGIAGSGAGYELAAACRVTLLEQEAQCGYHATGRSAASFSENYGTAVIRRLAIASRGFFESPPAGFADHPLLTPRGMITIARGDQIAPLEAELARGRAFLPSLARIDAAEAIRRVPVLRLDYVAAALIVPQSMEVDVNGLHQGFLRGLRKRGSQVMTGAG